MILYLTSLNSYLFFLMFIWFAAVVQIFGIFPNIHGDLNYIR